MIQDQACHGSHSTFKDLQRCSGVGERRGKTHIFHAKWDDAGCPWREVSPGVEVYPVMSTDLDPSLESFVAGYALQFVKYVVSVPKLGTARATLREKTSLPSKLFQSPAKAAGYAAEQNAKASEKKRAHDASADPEHVDPLLGDRQDRQAAEAAYVRGRITGNMDEYERLRQKLPRQPEPIP